MVLRHQKVAAVLHPFESVTKDPDTSIRSVTAIDQVEKKQQQLSDRASPGSFCSYTKGSSASIPIPATDSLALGGNSMDFCDLPEQPESAFLPSRLSTNTQDTSESYQFINLPRESTLSLRDMFEYDDSTLADPDRNEGGDYNHGEADDIVEPNEGSRRDSQQFDMSPAVSRPIAVPNGWLTAASENSAEDCRNVAPKRQEPPLSTNSKVLLHHEQATAMTVSSLLLVTKNSKHALDSSSNEEAPPTPLATSPASSVSSVNAVKQHNSSSGQNHPPVLYSAIGSLEDPTTASSFSRRYNDRKFEFPSLLGPPAASNAKKASPKTALNMKNGSNRSLQTSENPLRSKKSPPTNQNVGTKSAETVQVDVSSASKEPKIPSSLRKASSKDPSVTSEGKVDKKAVTIASESRPNSRLKSRKKNSPPEMFRPSSDAYTPRMGKKVIKYKDPEMRTPVASMASPLGTLQRPNFRDALRRVAMILHQHVVKIEQRFENQIRQDDGLFKASMREIFSEDQFVTPTYRCSMVRVPMARPGMVYGLRRLRPKYTIPSEEEIYDFAHRLFKTVQLSSECSIVCLIYVERLMETAKVPLLSDTWRPIFMCGLLLASKVWQDLSSWNIEFASVYPQYSLDSINRLELLFLRNVKWDLYISSSCYAKYYFALRSLVEKQDFRQRYNRMVGGVDSVQASEALKIEKRSTMVKEEALSQLSRSM